MIGLFLLASLRTTIINSLIDEKKKVLRVACCGQRIFFKRVVPAFLKILFRNYSVTRTTQHQFSNKNWFKSIRQKHSHITTSHHPLNIDCLATSTNRQQTANPAKSEQSKMTSKRLIADCLIQCGISKQDIFDDDET